ncbi:MAG: DUF6551 family protein [Hyphomicrobium sp.]|jgi:hypothetical protein
MRSIDISKRTPPAAGDPGPAPMLQWLKIVDLVVDDGYQRDLKNDNWNRIRRIADRFRWTRFSPVFVAPVEGGKYAIIDGQHRTHAAALCGVTEVPCQVVHMTREEQAASFAAVNGMVTKVTGFNILRASLVAGERWAIDAAKVCADAGCELMTSNGSTDAKKPGEIYPIALIKKGVADGHGRTMTLVLAALRRSEFGKQAEAYSNEILKPFFAAVADRPWLLGGGVDLASFCDRFDVWACLDKASEFVKRRRREGVIGVSRYDIAAADIGEALDKAFPQRMRLPPPMPAVAAQ